MQLIERALSLLALACVGSGVSLVYYGYGRLLARGGDRTRALARLRLALKVGLPVTYVLAVITMTATGWLEVVDAVVAWVPLGETIVGNVLALVLLLGTPALAVVVAYLGALPVVVDLRNLTVSPTRVVLLLARSVAGLVALFVVLLLALGAVVDPLLATLPAGVVVLVASVGMVVSLLWATPLVVRLLQPTRRPDDDERERIAALLERTGLDGVGVRILRASDANHAFAVLRGLPLPRRHLFVTDYLLECADDDRLRALLALQAGRARTFHLESRLTITIGLVLGVVAPTLESLPGRSWLVSVAAGIVGLVALWQGRRLVYRGDAYAASRVGTDAVVDALEWQCAINDRPLTWSRRQEIVRMEPSPARRIGRLRERSG
ncbi:hypothetical protein ACFOZ7_01960 [Natribaculum luteum]|uniref:Peptidase n=1 Tax=Natribaculum luteum TaxID=1586232 RepID=A0ABD5NVK9_9EURY|nr:hypothetical protein [Natribaculum luteum]